MAPRARAFCGRAPAPATWRPRCIVLAGCNGDALPSGAPYRERPESYSATGRRRRSTRAGVFDYYVLALSWSPTYCADSCARRATTLSATPRGERPYAFVLHGLWPQYQRGWPQDCRSPDRGYVPGPVANRMLDIMPSDKLIFNEYRKHGTCSGLGVDGYFDSRATAAMTRSRSRNASWA